MTNVTEHNGEEERERDDGKQSRVDLLVAADSVRVDDGLEAFGELVGAVESGRGLRGAELVKESGNRSAGIFLQMLVVSLVLLPNTKEALEEGQRTEALLNAPCTFPISLVGTHPSATSVFLP